MPDSDHTKRRWGFDVHSVALVLAAAAPFVPAAWQFMQQGVPDYLFTGDGAILELRTLHASRGEQLLGAYSRFIWNHPGPLFFYLALPVYEAFGERGPALNLFMLLVNLAVAIAIVLTARRLRGNDFAWLVAGLLAIFELIALPFVRTGEWNPVSPMLPLVLLSFLTARLALGAYTMLPACALIASGIVQTHVGYLPEVLALTGLAAAWTAVRFATAPPSAPPARPSRAVAIITVLVLVLCWALPVYESATNRPGNLRLLVDFFSTPNESPPAWDVVFTTLFTHLTALPVAVARAFHPSLAMPGPMLSEAIAILEIVFVVAAGTWAWRRRDATLGVLAGIALAETLAAIAAVRGIRGDVIVYLVWWVTVPGFMTTTTAAAWLVPEPPRWHGLVAPAVGTGLVALALASPGAREAAFRPREPLAEQFASDVERALRSRNVEAVVIRIASFDAWPIAAGVILHLDKRRIPFYVEPSWAFMFGKSLVDPGGERPRLLFGSRGLAEQARTDALLLPVAAAEEIVAYFEEANALEMHRIRQPLKITTFAEMDRDPNVAVDGEIPVDGTSWDSSRSAIFRSNSSSLTVTVPGGDVRVNGLYASVDGDDVYTVRCAESGLSWDLGGERPEERLIGMQVRRVFSDRLAGCETVTIAPKSGDGSYSIAEIGFLR